MSINSQQEERKKARIDHQADFSVITEEICVLGYQKKMFIIHNAQVANIEMESQYQDLFFKNCLLYSITGIYVKFETRDHYDLVFTRNITHYNIPVNLFALKKQTISLTVT